MAIDGHRNNLSPEAANYIGRLEKKLKTTEAKVFAMETSVNFLTRKSALVSASGAGSVRGQVPSSVSVGSGSASVAADGTVTFTNVSRVSLNGVFDGLGADAYDILFVATTPSGTSVNITSRLRAAGADLSSGSYDYAAFQTNLSGGPSRSAAAASSVFLWWQPGYGGVSDWLVQGRAWLSRPATAGSVTMAGMDSFAAGNGNRYGWHESSGMMGTSAYDGITILAGGAAMTGTVKVVKTG